MARQIFTGQFGGKTVAMPQPDDAKRACEARQLVAPTVLVVLLSGCGSLVSRELYPEVRARQPAAITFGEVVKLLTGPVATRAIFMRANGQRQSSQSMTPIGSIISLSPITADRLLARMTRNR